MSLQEQMGLDDDGQLMQRARESWPTWCQDDPRLGMVSLTDFVVWQRESPVSHAGSRRRNEALLALAERASANGGDDVDAAAALATVLLPGAVTVAHRYGRGVSNIDSILGAQLWIEVRSFPWRRRFWVASNVMYALRDGVLRELGDPTRVCRGDKTWSRTSLLPEFGLFADHEIPTLPSPLRRHLTVGLHGGLVDPALFEVEDLLDGAVRHGVITSADRSLLADVLREAHRTPPERFCRRNGGLGGRDLTSQVGARLGVSSMTVRRRLSRSIVDLAAAAEESAA